MHRTTNVLLSALLLGCAVVMPFTAQAQSEAPAPAAAPPAPAAPKAPPPKPQKWEQMCERAASAEELNESVRKKGQQGWELVAVAQQGSLVACYKRPLP